MDRRVKKELMGRLEHDARRICQRFALCYRVLEPERANVRRRYGVCFSDGTIRIRLMHATTRRPLKYSSLVSTLCHELAHLRHFHHGPRFQAFYAEILEWSRGEGIYCPGPERTDPEVLPRRTEGASPPLARRRPQTVPVAARRSARSPQPIRAQSGSRATQLELFR